MIAVACCNHGEVEESGDESMAELVDKGNRSYVQISAYEAEVLTSWGERDTVIAAARPRDKMDAQRLLDQIVTFLSGKEIKSR